MKHLLMASIVLMTVVGCEVATTPTCIISREQSATPDVTGTWRVRADFGEGDTVTIKAGEDGQFVVDDLKSSSFKIRLAALPPEETFFLFQDSSKLPSSSESPRFLYIAGVSPTEIAVWTVNSKRLRKVWAANSPTKNEQERNEQLIAIIGKHQLDLKENRVVFERVIEQK